MKTRSRRLLAIEQSTTVAISDRAKELAAQGVSVVALSAGEPDLPTPAPIIEATVAALRAGQTRYTPVGGLPALRRAVAERFSRLYGVPFVEAEVAITVGGKQALYELFQSLLDPGDEVLLPAPHWVSYPAQVRLAQGVPVAVPSSPERRFELDVASLAAAITPRTVGVVINSPNNPTGAVLSPTTLEALAALVERHDLWVVSDDIYSALTYDGARFTSLLHIAPRLRERVFIVHGVSKTYGMTGFRVGFLAAPASLVRSCLVVQGQSTTGATSFAQRGALAALMGGGALVAGWLAEYDRRRRRLHARLNAIEGVTCGLPSGAFYLFADIRALIGRRLRGAPLVDDIAFARALLEEAHLALVPGSAFGAPGFLRLSYSHAPSLLDEAAARLARFVARLSPPQG